MRPPTAVLFAPALLGWGSTALFAAWWFLMARPAPGLETLAKLWVVGSGILAPCLIASQVYGVLGVLQFPGARRAPVLLVNFSVTVAMAVFAAVG